MAKKSGQPRKASAIPASALPTGYAELLEHVKVQIRSAQLKAALAVNRELVELYWQIGQAILHSQRQEGWGTKVIDRLAADLHTAYPDVQGFSPRNLKYMRAFAQAWPDSAIMQQLAAQIPWFHNCLLLDKVKDPAARHWYIRQTIEHGWSRAVLDHQLDTDLHRRQGKAGRTFAAPYRRHSRNLPNRRSRIRIVSTS